MKRTQQRKPVLLVSTRKGAFILRGDASRRTWTLTGPLFLGHVVHHLVLDSRDGRTLLMAARTGHLGPTVFRSTDFGKSWKEAERPPAFRKAGEGEQGRVVDHVFWLAPGHASEPGVWYAGTSPQGLFRSEDGGMTWEGVAGFNEHPMNGKWTGGPQDGTPDGPKLHSVLIDPRDAAHMYIGMSSGGVFESTDKGKDWRPLNKGCRADFLPTPEPEYGHDPHCVRLHPLQPDRLYQQNHCGIYRMDRSEGRWVRIGEKMPKKVGDIGFPIVLHPRDPDTAWVVPMDGGTVWPRVSPDGKPAVYVTRNAGKSWARQDKGLPKNQAWWTVKRQAMTADAHDPVGIYFATTGGEVWGSRTEGGAWTCVARHLPEIYSLEAAGFPG
ncbi:MAG: glycosyl hydrolase [Nitrospirae bacterium]|nr:MAG: glycosyl hydrolase [Nitrospirota bacterium]